MEEQQSKFSDSIKLFDDFNELEDFDWSDNGEFALKSCGQNDIGWKSVERSGYQRLNEPQDEKKSSTFLLEISSWRYLLTAIFTVYTILTLIFVAIIIFPETSTSDKDTFKALGLILASVPITQLFGTHLVNEYLSVVVVTSSSVLLLISVLYIERLIGPHQSMISYFVATLVYRIIVYQNIGDNLALSIVYSLDIESLDIISMYFIVVSRLLVWATLLCSSVLAQIFQRVDKR